MSRLLITEELHASSQLVWALCESDGATDGDVTLATLSPEPSPDAWLVERHGVEVLPLGRMGAASIERAVAGACRALHPTLVTLWAAQRAIIALPAVRDLSPRPEVEVHVPPLDALAWDEALLLAVRGQGLFDRYIAEDDDTAERLVANGARPRQVAVQRPTLTGPSPAPQRILVIHGASWERRSQKARELSRELRGRTQLPTAAAGVLAAVGLALSAHDQSLNTRPGVMVFAERHIPSAALARGVRRAGWRVALPSGTIADALAGDPGTLVLADPESSWADEVATWLSR